jgi:hypothetical protein
MTPEERWQLLIQLEAEGRLPSLTVFAVAPATYQPLC